MNHDQMLRFLNRKGNEVKEIHLGLQRIAALMEALGRPHLKYAVLHIAGTNGKGSVAAMAEAILRAAGLKTGLYTSPHLVRLEERIRVAGKEISTRSLDRIAAKVRQTETALLRRRILDRSATYFEFITACAFAHFADAGIDLGVIEVGLGGLLDATNIVEPKVCLITGISLDHQDLLGTTVAEIAHEKAGIIKRNIPVVSGCQAPSARRVIRARARSVGAPLAEIDKICSFDTVKVTAGRFTIDLQTPRRSYRRLSLALAGEHQILNAMLAVAGVEALGLPEVNAAAVRTGLRGVAWPGRLDSYVADRTTLLDGAHNPEGAGRLRRHLLRFSPPEIHLVFGVMSDKDVCSIGRLLFPIAKSIHLTPLRNARSAQPQAIVSMLSRYSNRMRIHKDSREALQAAWKECSTKGIAVVTGSLYLIGELLPVLRRKELAGQLRLRK